MHLGVELSLTALFLPCQLLGCKEDGESKSLSALQSWRWRIFARPTHPPSCLMFASHIRRLATPGKSVSSSRDDGRDSGVAITLTRGARIVHVRKIRECCLCKCQTNSAWTL